MRGFDRKYKDLPDYILKITEQIWENKDVESIGKFYTKDIPVRSPFGVTYGNKSVINATYATLKEFPNRQLLGEDVIWNGNDEIGYHSSHRILSKGTHLGDGFYGKPSGKDIYYRVIADCACKENQVYDEWIVRDQGAMVRQIGYSPKEFAKKIIESEGGILTASKLFDCDTDKSSNYEAERYKKGSKAEKYTEILKNIFNNSYKFEGYDRAANIFWPGNTIGHGREDIKEKWISLKSIFSDIKFTIEHVGFLEEADQNPRVSVRWFLEGTHSNDSMDYDKPSNKKIFIMGINHAEFYSNSIIREWVLFDEVAIWKQILLNHG
ncbi:ester cyclase [Candidatus Pelagibacter sp.]|nr:ester cyclase [Candidatus Pelagibacter sp.]